ncbi:MAG TPA: hypothetical protein VLJ17_15130 [Xanthobacteraceae bacterium]|nr:hypothetical protein [Xanthobacteraceae bacterium]
MKVISTKRGSSRERVDAKADLLPVAHWRINWKNADERPGFAKAASRSLVLSSRSGAERDSELWLTEAEALTIASAVSSDLFSEAAKRATIAKAEGR